MVAPRFTDADLVGTLAAINRLYAGTEVLPSAADLAYSVELMLYSDKCTRPWHFPVWPSLACHWPCLEDLKTAWTDALGSLFLDVGGLGSSASGILSSSTDVIKPDTVAWHAWRSEGPGCVRLHSQC